LIVDIDDNIISDNLSRIFFIRKQLRILNKKYDGSNSVIFQKTIESLEMELQKSRSNFCEELETKIDKKQQLYNQSHYINI
jgi:hypothetical protein